MIFFITDVGYEINRIDKYLVYSVRVTYTIQLNIKKALMGNQGFVQMFMW